jgi:hypothetical protein
MSKNKIIAERIQQAMSRYGLPSDSRVRNELEDNAVVGGGFQPEIVVRKGDSVRTLDERIRELRNDPDFRDCFPATRTISRDDQESIRAEFDAIARETTVVV